MNQKTYTRALIPVLLIGILLLYNNCGQGMKSGSLGSLSQNSDDPSDDPMDLPASDTTAPNLSFTQIPAPVVTSNSATIEFTVSDAGSGLLSVQCSLDGAAYANCNSPVNLSNLSLGSHSLQIRATDNELNTATISHSWTIINEGTGSITLALTPSRTSGVAPLYVFFDTTGTVSTNTNLPFHNIEYRWNFGDPGSGNWQNGTGANASRNIAAGPMAAHVFETPGVYQVTVTAFDGLVSKAASVQISVENPDVFFEGAKTECYSNNTEFNGCPSGATQVTTSNLISALNRANSGNQPRRLLFHRGHTFAAGTQHGVVSAPGPGIVGAFGTGNRPRFTGTGSDGAILELSRSATPTFSDWRVMDIEIDGTGTTSTSAHGISAEGGASQITILRVNLHHMSIGINFNYQLLDGLNTSPSTDGHAVWDQIAIVDCDIRNMFDNAGIYLAAKRYALLGTAVEDVNPSTTGHITRYPSLNKAIINHNTLAHPTPGLQTIKMHSAPWRTLTATATAGSNTLTNVSVNADPFYGTRVTGPGIPPDTFVNNGSGPTNGSINLTKAATVSGTSQFYFQGVLPEYTEQVVISDNKITGSTGQTRAVDIMPQSANNRDERLRNILVERNWFITGPGASHALAMDVDNMTVRNNICDASAASDGYCISVMQERPSSLGSGSNNIRIFNNTAFSSRSGGSLYMVEIESTVTNITVQNNLAYAPNVSDRRLIHGTGAGGLVQSNNTTNLATNPNFAVSPPSLPVHYKPSSGYPIGGGITVPVWSDFFLTPLTEAARDLGAVFH